jgi:hypothetical protein
MLDRKPRFCPIESFLGQINYGQYQIKQSLLHTLALIPNPSPEGEGSKIQSPSHERERDLG